MRFLTLPTLTVLAGGLLMAGGSASVTYVSGNIAELTPDASGILYVNNTKSMELRTPSHTVTVPFSQISKAELGAVQSHAAEPEAVYKVWTLPKRLLKSETRQMTVAFTNESGQNQTMTIELPKKEASDLLTTITRHSGKVANNNWWGDSYWRTTRNKESWDGAGTIAQK
ncbi:MAG TPA: hypothetical protein VGJ09_20310 [Bryobacteraceae bacterium]